MSPIQILPELPDSARAWIISLLRPVTEPERRDVREKLGALGQEWQSHGAEVTGGAELVYDRFIVVAADEAKTAVSGCSIDGMNRRVDQIAGDLSLPVGDHAFVYFRLNGGEITAVPREGFAELIAGEKVTSETIVFDNTVQTLGSVRRGNWEIPLRDSWHARAFDFK